MREEDGAPFRLRDELELGFKQVKWLQAIRLVESFAGLASGQGGFNEHWCETSEVIERVVAVVADGREAVIATVIRIEGFSYRRPGARLLIQDDGLT